MKLVVDAAVFVAEQIEEQPEFAVAERFFGWCVEAGARLYAPTIVLAEVAGAVARITEDASAGQLAALRLGHYPRLTFRQIDLPFAEVAARVAVRYALRGADAHYAALARELKCPLITNDQELLDRCPASLRACTPAAWLAARRRGR